MWDVGEGEDATCVVSGFKNEKERKVVEEIGWEMVCLLRGEVINGKRWREVHIRTHVGPIQVELVECDFLSAAVYLVLLSENWQVPLWQDMLVSAQVQPNLKLKEVACIKEKVGVAKADTSFRKLVTANEVDWESHHRVSNVRELVSAFSAGSAEPLPRLRDDCYYRRAVHFGVMRNNREEEGQLVAERVPVSVALMKANNKTLTPLLIGFDPADACIKGVLTTYIQKVTNTLAVLLCKRIDVPSLQHLLVHVQVPREDIYDSSFLVGAVVLQLTALAAGIALGDDLAVLVDLDWNGAVRRMANDPRFHAGMLYMLEGYPSIMDLNTVEPLRVLLEGQGKEVVGLRHLEDIAPIAAKPPMFAFYLPKFPKKKSDEEQAGERGESKGKGERGSSGQASKEGGKEGSEPDDRKLGGSEGRGIKQRKTAKRGVALPRQSNDAKYIEFWIQGMFQGAWPYRIIVPHLTESSTYGLALTLSMLLRRKAAGDIPTDSLFHAASEAVMDTFDYGPLRGDKTVTRVSARLDEIRREIGDLVNLQGLGVRPEHTLRHALTNLCAVMPEIGGLTRITDRHEPEGHDFLPDILRLKGSAPSFDESVNDAAKAMFEQVNEWDTPPYDPVVLAGDFTYYEILPSDYAPRFSLPKSTKYKANGKEEESSLRAIIYEQYVEGVEIPYTTADVLTFPERVVYVDPFAKDNKAKIENKGAYKYTFPSRKDVEHKEKAGPFVQGKNAYPAVVGLLYVRVDKEEEDEEEGQEQEQEEGSGEKEDGEEEQEQQQEEGSGEEEDGMEEQEPEQEEGGEEEEDGMEEQEQEEEEESSGEEEGGLEDVIPQDEFEEMFLNGLRRIREGAPALWQEE